MYQINTLCNLNLQYNISINLNKKTEVWRAVELSLIWKQSCTKHIEML